MFRVRTGRIAEADLLARLERAGFRLRALDGMPSFFVVEDGPYPLSLTLEHWAGLFYVQQASTGLAAETARAEVRALIGAKGHAVENAREAVARLERAQD